MKTPPHTHSAVTTSILAAPLAGMLMLFNAAAPADATPPIAQVVFGGMGIQTGTGVAVKAGEVYYSATDYLFNYGNLGKYNGALTLQNWSLALAKSPSDFQGVAVSNGVYGAGSSADPTLVADGVGGFENKSIAARTGLAGGAFNWRTQVPPAGSPFFPYTGTEAARNLTVSNSGGVDTIYTVGFAQSNGAGTGYGMALARVTEAGVTTATATFAPGVGTFGNGITTLGGNVFAVGTTGGNALIRAYSGALGFIWGLSPVVGQYNSVLAFNGDLYAVGGNGTNAIVSRYTAAGTHLWTQTYANNDLNGVVGVGGSLYAVGRSGTDAALLTLDAATGAVQNLETFGGAGTDSFDEVALDAANGAIYAIGSTDSVALGANGSDVWIAKFNVPEPGSAALLGLGTLLLAARRRRRAQA